ncbi:hypothetical protein TTHERM_001469326 (macronuclear) [Tetrahymena thermophila SB210]|uniref:Uncharacterized protein n=1 Tax=Tetrahymena thermophila (strain SB210) TaxID=312017 RepID=W7XHW7_TETTS|nr:hypothetical protein TTHERM_001469326 [Tetrahymena thermophila SB210]EWS74121.1 hypothetical protein TTHERM_001469326 [Tetrahymena thermophila SB210]|eukprot:XP_012653342.1 hypothetical protein TTHERM_001469326 [Tetrahymena thermophila SB210]
MFLFCQNLKEYFFKQFVDIVQKFIFILKKSETYFCFLDNRDISVNSFNLIKIFQGYFENLSELSFDSFNDFRQDFNSLINFASLTKLSIQSIWSLRNIKFDFWSALTNFCNLTCLELEFDEQIDEFQNMFDALSKFKSLRQFKIKSGIHNSYNEFDALIKQFSRKINCNNILNTFEFLIHLRQNQQIN